MRIMLYHKGDLSKTEKFLERSSKKDYQSIFAQYGQQGVTALASATPIDTGETSNSWSYSIEKTSSGVTISWSNSVMAGSAPLAILIQYGHGINGGGYVEGRDFINPAIRPIFDNIADNLWKEVTSL